MVIKDWGLTTRFQDIDNDGDPDIYVCNDFWTPDRIWVNNGEGKFSTLDNLEMRKSSSSTMSVDFSDIDRNGTIDFFVADMLSRHHKKKKTQMGLMSPTAVSIGKIDKKGYSKLSQYSKKFAEYEGFDAHANAVSELRIKAMKT